MCETWNSCPDVTATYTSKVWDKADRKNCLYNNINTPAYPKEHLTSRGMCELMVKFKADTPATGVNPCHRFTVLTVVGAELGVILSKAAIGLSLYASIIL